MRRITLLLGALSLAGCSLDPPLPVAPLPVPESWPVGDPYLAQSEAALPSLTFPDVFRDHRLLTLIDQALANNRDLQMAAANIAAARAQARITNADRLPEVTGTAGVSLNGSGEDSPRVGGNLGVGVPSFELDLFGRLASLSRADQQRLLATEAAARTVRLALIGDLAQAWATLAADETLLAIAEKTASSAARSVTLTEARLRGGVSPKTDVLQAQQILETARSDVAEQRTAAAQDRNLIQLLVGAPVDDALLPASIAEVAQSYAAPPAGLDSRILLRRPDIVEAEYRLRAANAEIGAARAARFPRISLTGLLGLASDALNGLFSRGSFSYSAGADASYSIFNAGAARARVELTQAQRDAALAQYERAIQSGFREVADALAERGTLGERLRSAQAQVSATAEAARLVEARYKAGIDPYLTSLDAQRSLYGAQRAQVLVQLAEMRNAAVLYQALGGT